jgi:hypothetical protein
VSGFQDETPVYVHLETDIGALAALIDEAPWYRATEVRT